MNKFILSTIAWVESIAKKEIEIQWWKLLEVRDRMVEFEWDMSVMVRMNLWSRVGNKVYMVLWERESIDDFDKLYDFIFSIDFKKYVKDNFEIIVKAKSIKSDLASVPSIQKISKKSIVDNLTSKSWEKLYEDKEKWVFEVFILILDNTVKILLNTSWEALHKRWYRLETWEAPIKENLAAALVLLSWWKFKEPFYDLFCWSGTIPIEAAMIAKNIAPWINRYFAFENLWLVEKAHVEEEIKKAKSKKYSWDYSIYASDIDENILKIARENAKDAGLENVIKFEKKDFSDLLDLKINWTLVSNPPYWDRLKSENIRNIYNSIDKLFRLNPDLWWWIITWYLDFDKQIDTRNYKKRKLYNWGELCYFYKRK